MIEKPLIFDRPGGGHFQIGTAALNLIVSYAQDHPDKKEAGGVLLGRHILNSNDIVVDIATQPMHGDRRGRFRFFRSQNPHQLEIDKAWENSMGTSTYLGEWHTHPEKEPRSSRIDRRDWNRRLRRDKFTEPIFFVIVGTAHIGVWEGWRKKRPFLLMQSKELK